MMYYPEKLKKDINIEGLIPAIVILLSFALTTILIGIKTGLLILGIAFLLYSLFSLYVFFRIHNISYVAAFVFQVFVGLYLLTFRRGYFPLPDKTIPAFFQFVYIVAGIWLFYLLFTRRAKWKGREVFELAAHSIHDDTDGFTGRPRPVGKSEYSPDDLAGFAEFLRQNLIAMPHKEEKRIVFVVVRMGDEYKYMLKPARFLKNRTWIAFSYQGEVTVCMSKKDYQNYRQELSFDQLCENLGKLFITFMEYYRKGDAERILFKLNELKLGLLS